MPEQRPEFLRVGGDHTGYTRATSAFVGWGKQRVVVFGLGRAAHAVLQAGAIDGVIAVSGLDPVPGIEFEYPRVELEDLEELDADAAVVATGPVPALEIIRRIGGFCRQRGIPVFDLDGHDVSDEWLGLSPEQTSRLIASSGPLDSHDRLINTALGSLIGSVSTTTDTLMLRLICERLGLQTPELVANDGRPSIGTLYDFGWSVIGPVLSGLVTWLADGVRAAQHEHVFFAARDGYVVQQCYDRLRDRLPDLPTSTYLRVSRALVTNVSLHTRDDVRRVLSASYAGPPESMLLDRFGLVDPVICQCPPDVEASEPHPLSADCDSLVTALVTASRSARESYQDYLRSMGMTTAASGAFVDLVSSGSSQIELARLTGADLTGYYLGRYAKPGAAETPPIHALMEPENPWGWSWLMHHYYFLETVLTSPEPSVRTMTSDGFVFSDDHRGPEDLADLAEIHQGATDFFDRVMTDPAFDPAILASPRFIDEAYHLLSGLRHVDDLPYLNCAGFRDDLGFGFTDLGPML